MAAEFAIAVVQETLGHLDSCQDGDYSRILLRLEYLNRTLINSGELPDSIVAGLGSAIACLSGAQQSSVPIYRADRSFTGRRGRPPFNVSEDQLVFFVDNGFTIPKISEMLGISKRKVERRMSMFGIRISGELLRTVPTKNKGFCTRLGPRGKSRSLQGLLKSTKKNRGSHAFFRDN